MPRRPRVESSSGLFHITSRAVRPARLFATRSDCTLFLYLLSEVERIAIHAYCLLGTHFHLVARGDAAAVAASMRTLKGRYGQEINRRRARVGPLFDSRYAALPIESDEHVSAAFVYIAMNPVEAGIADRPEQWLFGSHRAHAGIDPRPAWLAPIETLGVFPEHADYVGAVSAAMQRREEDNRGSDPGVRPRSECG